MLLSFVMKAKGVETVRDFFPCLRFTLVRVDRCPAESVFSSLELVIGEGLPGGWVFFFLRCAVWLLSCSISRLV